MSQYHESLVRVALLIMDVISIIPTSSQTIEPLLVGLDASQFSSSSEFDDEDCYDQFSTYSTTNSWCAASKLCGGEWLQVDFPVTKFVFRVGTKANRWGEYVKTYTIRYSENATWDYYNTAEILTGNSDSVQEKLNNFSTPIIAKRVRIYPQSANSHCSLRWELYGYDWYTDSPTSQPTNIPTTIAPSSAPTIQMVQTTAIHSTAAEANTIVANDLTRTNTIVAAILLFAVALPLAMFLIYKHKVSMENRKEFNDALRTLVKQVGETVPADTEQRTETPGEGIPISFVSEVQELEALNNEQAVGDVAAVEADEDSSGSNVESLFEEAPGLNKLPQSPSKEQSALEVEGDRDNGARDEYNKLVSWLLEHKLPSLLKNEAFMDQVTSINDILLLNESEILYFMEECGFRLMEKKKFLKICNALNHNEDAYAQYIDPQTKGLLHDDEAPAIASAHAKSQSQINIIIADDSILQKKVDVASDSDSLSKHLFKESISVHVDDETRDLPSTDSSTDEEDATSNDIKVTSNTTAVASISASIQQMKVEHNVMISDAIDLPSSTDEEENESLDNNLEAALHQVESEVSEVVQEQVKVEEKVMVSDAIDLPSSSDEEHDESLNAVAPQAHLPKVPSIVSDSVISLQKEDHEYVEVYEALQQGNEVGSEVVQEINVVYDDEDKLKQQKTDVMIVSGESLHDIPEPGKIDVFKANDDMLASCDNNDDNHDNDDNHEGEDEHKSETEPGTNVNGELDDT